MNKTKVLAVLLVLVSAPVVLFADFREHMDRIELGVSAGVGFYVGQKNPVAGSDLLRVQSYDAIGFGERATLKWPGIETFGFNVGYRFDTQWQIRLQTTRQRLCFAEYMDTERYTNLRRMYYNAMWHLDAMAEYNILNYGNVMMSKQKIYNVVPYVGFGVGITMYNKNATFRSDKLNKDKGKKYPQVGTKGAEVGVGAYIPLAFGVKWRMNDNVQLKGAFQYQLYLTPSSNLEGATYNVEYAPDRPTFDQLNKQFGANHDCLFSVSAIFNLGKWYEDRLITY